MNFPAEISPIIISAISGIVFFKYPLITLGALIEGPVLMVACGFFLRFNVLSLFYVFVALVIGDLLGDLFWYFIGYKYANPFLERFGKYFNLNYEVLNKTKELFYKYHIRILIISKFTLGFGMAIATLMTAGITRVPLKNYFVLNFLGEFFLVSSLLAIGYFFGELYTYIAEGFKLFFIIGIMVIVPLILYGFVKYAKKKILKL